MDVMPMIPLFSGVDVIPRTQTACRAAYQARGGSTRRSGYGLQSAKTLMSSRPKGLTLQSFFQTNISTKLSSIFSNNAESNACLPTYY
jgi:hypothetical protein